MSKEDLEAQAKILQKLATLGKSERSETTLQSYRTIIKSGKIYSLDLIGMGIESLPSDFFSGLMDLTHLYLSWNSISLLPNGIFDGLTNLVHLDLRGSGIQVIQGGIFDNLLYLQRIELNDNKLEYLPQKLFHRLRGLKEINLSNNQISKIPGKLFDGLRHLERLYLYFNPIPEDIGMGDYYDRETVEEAIEKLSLLFD